jgi:hypothetical protein
MIKLWTLPPIEFFLWPMYKGLQEYLRTFGKRIFYEIKYGDIWEHLRNTFKTTNRNYWELYENMLRTMWNPKPLNPKSKTFLKTIVYCIPTIFHGFTLNEEKSHVGLTILFLLGFHSSHNSLPLLHLSPSSHEKVPKKTHIKSI